MLARYYCDFFFLIGCWIHDILKSVDASQKVWGKLLEGAVWFVVWNVLWFHFIELNASVNWVWSLIYFVIKFFIDFIKHLLQHGHINIWKVKYNKLSGRKSSECPLYQNCWRTVYSFEKDYWQNAWTVIYRELLKLYTFTIHM